MMRTCFSTGIGAYWPCLRSSVSRAPRSSWAWLVLSSSVPNWAKVTSSRYWARSSLSLPATCFMALIWALPPTRETEMPTLMAGRRPAEEERDLAVGRGVLGQVIVDDQGVAAVVAEIFADGAAGERRQELERGRIAGRGGDDDGVVHGPVVLERLDDLGDRGVLLADGDVDAHA